MKELLIKIRALFEGRGISEATKAADDLGRAGDKAANSGLKNLRSIIDDAAGRAGIFGGAVSALGGRLIDLGTNAVASVISGLRNLAVGFAEGIKGAASFADQLSEMASKTGQSVETVAVLQQAFKNAGMGADAVAPAINKLQRALAGVNEDGVPTAEVFGRLGLSIDTLRKTDSATALQMIGTAISGLKDPALQAQAAFDIFGRSSVNLMAILKDPTAFDVAKQQLGDLGLVLGASAEELGRFADAYENGLDAKKMGFFAGAAQTLSGDLGKAADAMNALPTVQLGMAVGNMLRDLREWVQPVITFGGALDSVTGKANTLLGIFTTFLKANPFSTIQGQFLEWFTSATQRAGQQIDELKAKAQQGAQAPLETADQILARIAAEAGTSTAQAGQAASQGVATAGAQAAEGIKLTADQIKIATQQITAAMAQANTQGVTPAITALTNAVQESFARISGELTTGAANLQAAQAEQLPAFTEAVAQLTATMAASSQATITATATIAQSVTASAEQTVAATQQSAQAINQAFGQITQAIVQSNQALASGLSALAANVNSSLQNLQSQINVVASRIR